MPRIITCVTIDTEPDSDYKWNLVKPFKFEAVKNAVPVLRTMFNKYNVRPVYFVSPSVANDTESINILKNELKFGAEIGTHLHCEEFGGSSHSKKGFACFSYPDDVEKNALSRLHTLVSKNFGINPISFRAGRFGADINTVKSLKELGYKVDSSVTPNINWSSKGGPDFRGFYDQPYFINLEDMDYKKKSDEKTILEIPITIGGKRIPLLPDNWYFYKWLRPSHMTLYEMKKITDWFIRKYNNNDVIVLCLMFHNVEIMPGLSPYVRNELGRRKFLEKLDQIMKYLKNKGSEFLTAKEVFDIYA